MATLPINPTSGAQPIGIAPNTGVGGTGGGASQKPIPIATPMANPTQAAQANPYIPASATPQGSGTLPVGAAAGATPVATGTSISNGLSTQDGSNTLVGDFSDTYGKGTGTALADTLASLGTATNGAVSATNSAIEADAAKSYANIASGEAASGVTANSSTAALAQGDFEAGVNQNIASTDANMELSEENTLISALQSEGQSHGPDGSTFDSILGGIGDAAQVASLALL